MFTIYNISIYVCRSLLDSKLRGGGSVDNNLHGCFSFYLLLPSQAFRVGRGICGLCSCPSVSRQLFLSFLFIHSTLLRFTPFLKSCKTMSRIVNQNLTAKYFSYMSKGSFSECSLKISKSGLTYTDMANNA
jgi:hypothetical protein